MLLYGHLDKQPEFTGWLPGLGPWEPVIRDGKLYGRGAADDGYAVFSSLTAIAALKEQQVKLPRCLVLIEACEESGSTDLPAHLRALGSALGEPSLVVCLDAECGNYEQVWCTTSLRGNLTGNLRVRVLTEGVHSGMATGIAPTAFRILEQLLARIESPVTGDLLLDELHVALPADRRAQAQAAAKVLGDVGRRQAPLGGRRPAAQQRPHRTPHQQHLAGNARGDRRRGAAAAGLRRQRAAAGDRLQALAAPAADLRCRARHPRGSATRSSATRPMAPR